MHIIKNFFYHIYRTFHEAINGFFHDNCYLNASALAFFSLLAIVPVLAVAFGIAKGFGFQEAFEQIIMENFSQQPEFAQKVILFAHKTLEQTHSSLIAGIGVVILFWTAFASLGYFEDVLNMIWKIPKMRSWSRKIPDYLAVLILAPLFLVASGSLTVFVMTKIVEITSHNDIYKEISFAIYGAYYLLLLFLGWTFFTFILYFMPNRKVPISAAIFAGIIAGTLFQIVQWSYIYVQVYVTSYNAIYGSFAAIPLFLIWLQISWLITLIGGEISYHYARTKYSSEGKTLITEKDISLLICALSMKKVIEGGLPITLEEIAEQYNIPLRILEKPAEKLVKKGLLNCIQNESNNALSYQPAKPFDSFTLGDIYFALFESIEPKWQVAHIPALEIIQNYWKGFMESKSGPALKEVADSLQ